MTELVRDTRWESVRASVTLTEEFIEGYSVPVYEFLIELRVDDRLIYSRICIPPDELKDAAFSLYNAVLDKMVKHLDKELEKMDGSSTV